MVDISKDELIFFPFDRLALLKQLGKARLLETFKRTLLIRNFEVRTEASYLQGKIGGFFHSYMGQEAIQTAAVDAMGSKNWWIASYRCHALALLLGITPEEIAAELFGRTTGNAKGRGGSMHLYADRMLGGFGIVAGQIPAAVGAAFALKYQEIKDQVAVCFFGDGACAQGAFHESLNLASLWNLPCIFVIENNQWGMGTAVKRALCMKRLAEESAPMYHMQSYTTDGTDYLNCYACFAHCFKEVLSNSRPVIIEAVVERFRGHSISDPGNYRTKVELKEVMQRDPITNLKEALIGLGWLKEEEVQEIDKQIRQLVIEAIKRADQSPWPDPITLEEDVFAP